MLSYAVSLSIFLDHTGANMPAAAALSYASVHQCLKGRQGTGREQCATAKVFPSRTEQRGPRRIQPTKRNKKRRQAARQHKLRLVRRVMLLLQESIHYDCQHCCLHVITALGQVRQSTSAANATACLVFFLVVLMLLLFLHPFFASSSFYIHPLPLLLLLLLKR